METVPVVRLANDIAAQFVYQPPEQGAETVAAFIRRFWEPRLRAELLDLVGQPGNGLRPLAQAAAERLSSLP